MVHGAGTKFKRSAPGLQIVDAVLGLHKTSGMPAPGPLTTKLQPTQPPLPAPRVTWEEEVGDEYLIPRAIREQFESWPYL